MVAVEQKKVSYSFGTALALKCIEPWSSDDYNNFDYEVIGFTTIREMTLMGLNFYEMHIKNFEDNSKVLELYHALDVEKQPIYILKKVIRNPYKFMDITEGIDNVTEYFYIADTMIDKNNTKILFRRAEVYANIKIGVFYEDVFDNTIGKKFLEEINSLLDTYSDKYSITDLERNSIGDPVFSNKNIILQEKEAAEAEDALFNQKQKEAEEKKKAAEEAERKRLEEIARREKQLVDLEQVLIRKRKEVTKLEEEAAQDRESAAQLLDQIQRNEKALIIRELELAEKAAELDQRAKRIRDRENQLGIPNSDL